jgi:ribosomal protein S5
MNLRPGPTEKTEAMHLLERIAGLNNIYGFVARHYIHGENNAINFIKSTGKALSEGAIEADEELKSDISSFNSKL